MISTTTQVGTMTLTMPRADMSFARSMAKRMGWTIERKTKRKARLYDPETGEYLNDETMKVIEDARQGKGIEFVGTVDEFKEWARAL